MALTANSIPTTAARGLEAEVVANTTVIFGGAIVAITSAGFATNWADTAGNVLAGLAEGPATGDTSATPPTEITINTSGPIVKNVAVVGSTGQTDVGALCFASDENTYDLSATSNVKAVGAVTRYYSGTNCDVRLFTPAEYQALN